jgi:hypothetical protein
VVQGAVVIIPPTTPTVSLAGAVEARTVEARLAKARVIFLEFAMTMDVRRLEKEYEPVLMCRTTARWSTAL